MALLTEPQEVRVTRKRAFAVFREGGSSPVFSVNTVTLAAALSGRLLVNRIEPYGSSTEVQFGGSRLGIPEFAGDPADAENGDIWYNTVATTLRGRQGGVNVNLSGSGAVATDSIWDALGDLVYGTGPNTGAKLAGDTTDTRKFLRELSVAGVAQAPVWDTILDADIPATLMRDAEHTAIGDSAPHHAAAHNIFSADHADTTGAAAPVDGDVIIANATPKWSKLAISIPAANVRNVLGVDNGELRPSWKTALDATNPADVAAAASPGTSLVFAHRDHVHAHPNLGDLHTVYFLADGTRDITGAFDIEKAEGVLFTGTITGEANPTVKLSSFKLEFGPGGASALDIALEYTGVNTLEVTGGVFGVASGIATSDIAEYIPAAGVTIDGLLIKDGAHAQLASGDLHTDYLLATGTRAGSTSQAQSFGATGIKADVLAEASAGVGVTVDGLLIKDEYIEFDEIAAPGAGAANKLRLYTKDVGGATTLEAVNSAGKLYPITHPPTVHVTRSTVQNITSAGSLTAISWDTEGWDSDGMWEGVTNPTRLTAPIDGIYRIWGRADWQSEAGGRRLLRIRKDGATILDADEFEGVVEAGMFPAQGVYAEYPLLATNYVELMVQCTTVVNTDVNSNGFTHFGMTWVRPIV